MVHPPAKYNDFSLFNIIFSSILSNVLNNTASSTSQETSLHSCHDIGQSEYAELGTVK